MWRSSAQTEGSQPAMNFDMASRASTRPTHSPPNSVDPSSDKTKIEWTDATWNPVTGCTRVSPGCTNCYIDWAPPFRIEGRHFTVPCEHCGGTGFEPMTGKFRDSHTCSICKGEGEHTFQVLTKRHGRMRVLLKSWDFRILVHDAVTELNGAEHDEVWPPPNVWVGVTVEDQQQGRTRGRHRSAP